MNKHVREEPCDVFTTGPRDRSVAITTNGDLSAFHIQIYDSTAKTNQPLILKTNKDAYWSHE